MSNVDLDTVINLSYAWFSDRVCCDETINEFLDGIQQFVAQCGVSRSAIYDELSRRHNVRIFGDDAILDGKGDHEDWFNPSTGRGLKREIDWHFWDHYKLYLINHKKWPRQVVENLDVETNKILSRLEDPFRTGQWDRRGMVIGSVQSGKTANFTGLIAKAIDSGYKLIVVIAGVHNSLRSQTQFRLNEELLGYHLDRVQEFDERARSSGVRKIFPDHGVIQTLTNASENGDFKRRSVETAGLIPSKDGLPTILVIKKHVSILRNLLEWSTSIIGKKDSTGRVVIEDIPIMVIDDECDYASVNTKKVVRDEYGNVDPECDPAQTNKRIRQLLAAFHKSIYVGYTATPFANIFIHHDELHPAYGQDLFPRNFIVSLPQPSNYVGPARLFGLNENRMAGIEAKDPLPLLRYVSDAEVVFPSKHKKELEVFQLPDSLKEAIKAFLIVCAIRLLRGNSPKHNSMLIHVTRFTLVQAQVQSLVERELKRIVDRIRSGDESLADLKELWERDFVPTTADLEREFGCKNASWDEVVKSLYPIAKRIKVKSINGSSAESLEYRQVEMETQKRVDQGEEVPWEEQGENVISIGGDKLSRGLTLDGLTVSYYLRASKMYDTLMQMGRWFGYRDGYEDLCRIYTTRGLCRWYRFIATASIELRNELKYMERLRQEPQTFGLKVLDHPGQLAITSAGKRRNSERLKLNYSGRIGQTIVFDLTKSRDNLVALEKLIQSIDAMTISEPPRDNGTVVWNGLDHQPITEFLDSYQTDSEAATVVDPAKMSTFIKEQLVHGSGDLTEWSVAVVSKSKSDRSLNIGSRQFGCVERVPRDPPTDSSVAIGTLISPSDEWLDFSESEKTSLCENIAGDKPTGKEIRGTYGRPKNRGFLMIYPIYCSQGDKSYGLEMDAPVYGIAISFPESGTTVQVQYEVNSVFRDAEDQL